MGLEGDRRHEVNMPIPSDLDLEDLIKCLGKYCIPLFCQQCYSFFYSVNNVTSHQQLLRLISATRMRHMVDNSLLYTFKYEALYLPTINFIIFVNTPFNESPKEQPRIAWLTSILSF
jgi:hypothetical protein